MPKGAAGGDKSTAATDKGAQTRSYTATGATLTVHDPEYRAVAEAVAESDTQTRIRPGQKTAQRH